MSQTESQQPTIELRRAKYQRAHAEHAAVILLVAVFVIVAVTAAGGLQAASQAAGKETLPGVVNYTRVDANVAVGGALSLEAIPELKRRGFKAVINLRRPTEPNANVEAEGEAVRAAGLKYINLPFSAAEPYDVAAGQVAPFLKALAEPSNLPVLIHSAQSHRPVGMLVIKRVVVEGWSLDKAFAADDAQVLSDGSAGAKGIQQFVRSYITAHPR